VEAQVCQLEALISAEKLRVALEPLAECEGELNVAGQRTENLVRAAVTGWKLHGQAVAAIRDELVKQGQNQELRAGSGLTSRG
jgi:hypothetical protein